MSGNLHMGHQAGDMLPFHTDSGSGSLAMHLIIGAGNQALVDHAVPPSLVQPFQQLVRQSWVS